MTNSDAGNSRAQQPAHSWAPLLTAHESWLKQVIRARTGEPQVVDDIFQQLACIACSRGETLREVVNLAPWFHRVAVILSARHRRTMARAKAKIARAANCQTEPPNSTSLDLLLDLERHALTRKCLEGLEPRDREILVLKYEGKWSYRDLAQRLGITEKAVDRRLARARQKLRESLVRAGFVDRDS